MRVVRVEGDDGEFRPWHYTYKGRRGRWGTPTRVSKPETRIRVLFKRMDGRIWRRPFPSGHAGTALPRVDTSGFMLAEFRGSDFRYRVSGVGNHFGYRVSGVGNLKSEPRNSKPETRIQDMAAPFSLGPLGDAPALRGGGKSYFSISLICTTGRRIPAGASANQGPEKGDLMQDMAAPFSLGPRGDAPALPRVDTSGFMLAEGSQIPGTRNPKPGSRNPEPGSRNRVDTSGCRYPVRFSIFSITRIPDPGSRIPEPGRHLRVHAR